MTELIDILRRVELFQGLGTDQLARLAAISHRETHSADAVIFTQGSTGDALYIVTAGQVEIRFNDGSGGSQAALYMGEGQLIGEMALLDQGERSATVVTVEDGTTLYAISKTDFMALCEADTGIGFILMRNMAMDLSFKLRQRSVRPAGQS